MRAAVIGLGVEGRKASKSLLNHGWSVYASDLQTDINLKDIGMPITDINVKTDNTQQISIVSDNLYVDLGSNDINQINDCDAIVLSPSMWNSKFANEFKLSGKLLQDIINKHRKIYTIGVTGTNGKTTSVYMIKSILEKFGKKVLVGGNAGGGFEGYYDIILEAESGDYDVLLVEVCDMTLSFCDYCFNFDLVALTNMGNDHMDVHGSMENYRDELIKLFNNKNVIISEDQIYSEDFSSSANNLIKFSESTYDLKVVGKFNRLNAGLAIEVARQIGISDDISKETLENFEVVEGRLKVYRLYDSSIYVGKTDNSDAVKSIFDEIDFYAAFIGTPRSSENHRLNILDEVVEHNPQVIVLFPGLANTVDMAMHRLDLLNYEGEVNIANNLDDLISFVAEYAHEDALFIGGNGQEVIISIQKRLEKLCEACND
ncbi:Mur ligase family protein [uncultured Methanobrevibacter sp.]|uniref:Mur ligase family protein n=1 Tax=uncultured Methanobrevibacter sp. TaxID=253161 RepID=UPI0025D83678|nr:Mur ligase family protein [uncultured Methanobrevibacter sp.]